MATDNRSRTSHYLLMAIEFFLGITILILSYFFKFPQFLWVQVGAFYASITNLYVVLALLMTGVGIERTLFFYLYHSCCVACYIGFGSWSLIGGNYRKAEPFKYWIDLMLVFFAGLTHCVHALVRGEPIVTDAANHPIAEAGVEAIKSPKTSKFSNI